MAEAAEYDPALFPAYAAAQDRHFWFRHRNAVIAHAVRRLRGGWTAKSRVLEVGCGTGAVLRMLETECRPATVAGLELFPEALAAARTRVGCELIQGDVKELPAAGGYDLMCAFDVIEHLDDDAGVLRAMRDRLAPGGRVMVTVPALMSLWSYFDEGACHRRRYTATTLRASFAAAGLRVERLTYFMLPLVPLVWLNRRARPAKAGQSDADRLANELKVVPGVNGLMRAALWAEYPFLAAGVRLPVGTSLLAVGVPQ